ncbi:hypothetical protein DL96DRAFT_1675894 [Flagelloscypha sp. PMI_526]|nr:hypothetical protein DL96DRAFT_1675894 [Flagelloscypha sp. PMI_526]
MLDSGKLEDIRYKTLIIWSSTPSSFIHRLSSKSPDFLATHVSHVWVNSIDCSWLTELKNVLSLCTGITHLALVQDKWGFALDTSLFPRLRSLVLIPSQIYCIEKGLVNDPRLVFMNLTHLDWATMGLTRRLRPLLRQLPALTHVMVLSPDDNKGRMFLLDLEGWRGVKREITIVVYHAIWTSSSGWSWCRIDSRETHVGSIGGFDFRDERWRVIWVTLFNWNFLDDWKTGLIGGNDFWSDLETKRVEFEHSRRS